MAILDIKKAGDPVLKQVAAPVDRLTKWHRKLLDDMAETMYSADWEVTAHRCDRRAG